MKLKSNRALIIHLILSIGAVLMIIPFIWMVLTSLKTMGEVTQVPPTIIPNEWNWASYVRVFDYMPFLQFYWNTIMMTVGRTVGQLIICSFAAYAFARIVFPGRNVLFIITLSVLMVPLQAYAIPQYLIMVELNWLNTLQALIVPGLFSAFGVFLLRQFFMGLPKELDEAARIDGCNHFQIFFFILLPLTKPALISLAIFTMLWSWNDLLWPLIVNSSQAKLPLSAGLVAIQGQYSTNFPVLMAGSLLAIWPMVLIFIFLQRYFIEGITMGSSK
ncbi:sugar ABC transporter permease [Alkalihalobacillus alcalophilus ATCC 27647 = CGMCC 1.3604]|uniref:Sugar ABC transporter permease n=1 Tax=Alkalihalobacillus alcalophilus ATCC 27647 = CGMCC 1.3604 TaxID=1218173 RepID=J8T9Y6_ALKAL|nr:carbohydrate ABC transporter permease [Alkalihalobacillus alcalophilus]AFV25826.1 sugar transporter [Alkalihalobacillus alcalophilus ATCC 27647 = CGMCC 1.3604]KGA99046.1 sugar ABC transporter permease [Alkalihalobacillus alcalophilus ATCC 27647 = CGMCC 1.3604]MED1560690.1 carbohydrate ABC transporter permease [Alkalihalobacillus alcalophilus]THG89809.1 sugar ABC transporter permease [Alkalihalobacillus alcalophilus ATCC 27647 = CGMCC 1.3604]